MENKELGITPEDALGRAYNGMAVRLANDLIASESDEETYNPANITEISFNTEEEELEMTVGGEITLSVVYVPTIANTPSLTWESGDPSIATVENGIVCAIAAGTTKITATDNRNTDLVAEITVVVE